ncbi:large exoprotein involved in heme utilization and adhesion [Paraburkholderia sp. UCT70]|uniref:two-partner secretion domain-containing protein n=1 Tax=Paraburkholderia sp. UCT70 TaxID=2991068 RepID=UPI003D2288D7
MGAARARRVVRADGPRGRTTAAGRRLRPGQGATTSGTTSLTIDQSSSRGVIDWHSFSIGNGNTVAFNNGSGASLNRVTGGDPSSILGKLTATAAHSQPCE